jgi:phage gp46-like protein
VGRDRKIDPATRDYVRAGGARATTTSIQPRVYHAVTGKRNRWAGDPNQGSELYTLTTKRLGPAFKSEAIDGLAVALEPFVSQGLARDLRITVEIDANGRALIEGSLTDVQAGPIDLSDLTPFQE